jgi:radical SAM protein with 4Fe4S-binding SPASM domain
MDFNTFKITLDRLKGIPIKSLILSGFGECLLDRKLIDKLRYLKARQQAGDLTGNSMLVTNGVALVPELSQVIVREDLVDVVSISIDCGTRTTYEKIHKYDGFDTIITNLEHIFRLKSSLRKAVPEINLRYKDFDLNQGEFMTFLRLFQPISNSIHIYANICKWPNSREKLPTILKSIMIRKPCVGNLWNGIRINWNGDVTICPQDYEGTAIYGNVLRSTIAELWHGPQIKEYRAMHKAFQFQKIPCCADCDINSHLVSLF